MKIVYIGVTKLSVRKFLEYVITWVLLIAGIIIGCPLKLNYGNIFLTISGYLIFMVGMYIHYLSHKTHPKAHKDITEIDYIATAGIYSWVRHPGYLGLILAFIGLALAFGSIPGPIISVILSLYHYYLACKEEDMMIQKFGDAYIRYMNEVPDKLIPIKKVLRKRKSRES